MNAFRRWMLLGGAVGLLGGCALPPSLGCTAQEQVAVQESLAVGGLERLGHAPQHAQRVVRRKRPVPVHVLRQVDAVEVVHDQVRPLPVRVEAAIA